MAFGDDAVLARLEEEAGRRQQSTWTTLNSLVREGPAFAEKRRMDRHAFQVKPFAIGLKAGFRYDSTSELPAAAEGDDAH
jgi:hypothetical protein